MLALALQVWGNIQRLPLGQRRPSGSTVVSGTWAEYPSDGPIVAIPRFVSGNGDQIELIRAGKLFVDPRGKLQHLDAVDWATNDHNFVSVQLHGLAGIGTVLAPLEKLPSDVETKIGEHILDWARAAYGDPNINPRAWNEGTVIKRQSNLLHALNYLRQGGGLGPLDRRTLLFLIENGARFLLDALGIYVKGNHGIRQDLMLAATALSLPRHPRATEMLDLAHRRLEEAATELFTTEGIWREHSPGYVHYALRLMLDVKALADTSEAFTPRLFLDRFEASRNYLLTSLTPHKRLPPIGQGGSGQPSRRVVEPETVETHIRSRQRTVSAFPGYGHAIVRGDHPNGLYLLFVASQNLPAGKRHEDALSFVLYNHNRCWITEGGHVTYERGPVRDFTLSAQAHNTYILDGRPLDADSYPERPVKLTQAEQTETGIVLAGLSERFATQASFERTVKVDPNFSRVTLNDRLSAKNASIWEGRLHIPGDLVVTLDGSGARVSDPETGHILALAFRSEAKLTFSTRSGENNPMSGWGQNHDGFGPITTFVWHTGENAEIEIDMRFSQTGQSAGERRSD